MPVAIGGLEDVSDSNDEVGVFVVPALIADTVTWISQEAHAARTPLHFAACYPPLLLQVHGY